MIQGRVILEGKAFRARFEEKIEGVVHGHLGHDIDFNQHLLGGLEKNQASQEVGLWVLLPIDEMFFGRDPERIAQNPGAAVRRRPQADHLWTELHRPVVKITSTMIERDVYSHS